MPHRLRKVRKQRGSRTHGWGRVGQHRGKGMRGGHGKAGRHKHKWTHVIRYQPDYFGKHGFKRPWAPNPETINVGELDERIEELQSSGLAEAQGDGFTVDLSALGIEKLLGSGKVKHPLIVKVKMWSGAAARKIKEAGGHFNLSKAGE
jgi:large subunit ribosomal protein L15